MRLLTASLLLATALAAEASGPPPIYDEGADAKAAIKATLAEAGKAKLPVLVVVYAGALFGLGLDAEDRAALDRWRAKRKA